jgi:hypothetical protein
MKKDAKNTQWGKDSKWCPSINGAGKVQYLHARKERMQEERKDERKEGRKQIGLLFYTRHKNKLKMD